MAPFHFGFITVISLFQQTPLHIAAREGNTYTVELLVKRGADVNRKDTKEVLIMDQKVDQHCIFVDADLAFVQKITN